MCGTRGQGLGVDLAVLRAELKEWERNFSAANGGRRAGREDIKKDAAIGV